MSVFFMHKETFDISASMPNLVTTVKANGEKYSYEPKDDFFEVDELIALPLQMLNRKGWRTACSCSGHAFSPVAFDMVETDPPKWLPNGTLDIRRDSYITFAEKYVFPSLPKGFEITPTQKSVRIFKIHNQEDPAEKMRSITSAMNALYEWAIALSENKENSISFEFIK